MFGRRGIQMDTIPRKSVYLSKDTLSFNIISEKTFFEKSVLCIDSIVPQGVIITKKKRKGNYNDYE